jgi:phage terminase large subunit
LQQIVNTGYIPRTLQAKLHVLIHLIRFVVLVMHRRFGKTVFTINELLDRSLHCKLKNPQYAYICPTYSQAKRIAWQYLKEYCQFLPGYTANEAELKVTLTAPHGNGKITIHLLGADNADALRGMYFDGVILDEYGDFHPDVWSLILRPALSDRLGWAIFIGTPKGHNDFKAKYDQALKLAPQKQWCAHMIKASESGILPQSELDAALEEMGPEAYNQEYECSWSSTNTGAYYAKYINDLRDKKPSQILNMPYDPALLVDTFWDLGIGDTTAIWFRQQTRMELRYIDYYEINGADLAHFVKILKEKPYAYGRHVLPHDGAARDLSTGKSRQETLRGLGVRTEIQARHRVEDQIQAARTILPKCYFDRVKCERGLNALENFTQKWDAKNKIFSNTYLHNWASNGAFAFQVSAMDGRDSNTMKDKQYQIRSEDTYSEMRH